MRFGTTELNRGLNEWLELVGEQGESISVIGSRGVTRRRKRGKQKADKVLGLAES